MPMRHPEAERMSFASLSSFTVFEMLPTTQNTMHATNAGKITVLTSFIIYVQSTAISGEYPATVAVAPSVESRVSSTGKIALANVEREFTVSPTVLTICTIPLISTITIAE